MQELISNFLFVGTGLAFTLKLLIGGLLLGVSLGGLLSVLRYNKICIPLINGIISVIRGTPYITVKCCLFYDPNHCRN